MGPNISDCSELCFGAKPDFSIYDKSSFAQVVLGVPFWADQIWGVRNGFVYQQPLVLLGVYALFLLGWRTWYHVTQIICVAVILVVESSSWDFWAGGSFGARRLTPILPVLYPFLLQSWHLFSGLQAPRTKRVVLSLSLFGLFLVSYYGLNRLSKDRVVAVEKGLRLQESPFDRNIGKITAYPLLLSRQLSFGVNLDRAYRLSWYNTLFRWPNKKTSLVDIISRGSMRFEDLLVHDVTSSRLRNVAFVIPLHRSQPAWISIETRQLDPIKVSLGGQELVSVYKNEGVTGFRFPVEQSGHWFELSVTSGVDNTVESIRLHLD